MISRYVQCMALTEVSKTMSSIFSGVAIKAVSYLPVRLRLDVFILRPFLCWNAFLVHHLLNCCRVDTCCILLRLSLLDFSCLSSLKFASSLSTAAIWKDSKENVCWSTKRIDRTRKKKHFLWKREQVLSFDVLLSVGIHYLLFKFFYLLEFGIQGPSGACL